MPWPPPFTLVLAVTSDSPPSFSLLGLSLRDALPHLTPPFPHLLEKSISPFARKESRGHPNKVSLKRQAFFTQLISMEYKFYSENTYVLVRTIYVVKGQAELNTPPKQCETLA